VTDPAAGPRPVVVTDSTASLPEAVAARADVVVVPLQVVIGATVLDEGEEGADPAAVAAALREFRPVSTSRPSPARFLAVHEELAARGVTEVLAVHLSGEMSGTLESAQLAARDAAALGVRVEVVDTRQVGVATGYAVEAALAVLDAGGSLDEAAAAATARAEAATSLFYVDTLEHLRRGGRIGAAAALLGGALAVKPLLTLSDGTVTSLEKVRTSGRALARLLDLAVEAAGDGPVDACVAHLAAPDRAATLAEQLGERITDQLEGREVRVLELGAVLGAHVGPGMVAVCVAPRLPR